MKDQINVVKRQSVYTDALMDHVQVNPNSYPQTLTLLFNIACIPFWLQKAI